MKRVLGYTHFEKQGETFLLFTTETCDNCRTTICGANPMRIMDSKNARSLVQGMVALDEPSDAYLTDNGDVVCQTCYHSQGE